MRAAFGMLLLATTAMVGGCGQTEGQIRDEIRAQLMNRCGRDIAPGTADLPGFDSNVFCGCITDKAMGQRSVAELKSLFDEGSRPQLIAEGRQAATECLAQLSANAADKAAPAPEPANASTPAPAPAPAVERERPREKAVEPAAPARPRIDEVRDAPQPSTQPVAQPPAPPSAATPVPPPRPEPEPAIVKEGPRGRA